MRNGWKWTAAAAILLCLSACGTKNALPDAGTDGDADLQQKMPLSESLEGETENGIPIYDEQREGASADTVAIPADFPEAYAYGNGRISDWNQGYAAKKMPKPKGNQTVLNTVPDPAKFQALYLWEEGNVPAVTEFTGI